MSDQPAPAESVFAIRWSLLGTRFCIRPSFWIVSALWGYLFNGYLIGKVVPDKALLFVILIWVLCTLVSVLVHELGHVIMGRIFGQPGSITLAGLGGQAVGEYERLTGWQRILVASAGPGAGFIFLVFVVLFDFQHWNSLMDWFDWPTLKLNWCFMEQMDPVARLDRRGVYYVSTYFLFLMNLFWNLINLIPIVPMDGGMIFKEICCMISPQGGLKFAYGWSLLLSGTLALYYILLLLIGYLRIRLPFVPPTLMIWPILGAIMFSMMAWQCFQALRMITAEQKRSHYTDTFTD